MTMRSISRSRRRPESGRRAAPAAQPFRSARPPRAPLGQRLQMLLFGARRGGIVVVADARGLRCRNHQRVIGVKEDEIRAELAGLRQRKRKGFLVGGNLGGEQDGGGFAPTRLEYGCHGNLLRVRQTISRIAHRLAVLRRTARGELNHFPTLLLRLPTLGKSSFHSIATQPCGQPLQLSRIVLPFPELLFIPGTACGPDRLHLK